MLFGDREGSKSHHSALDEERYSSKNRVSINRGPIEEQATAAANARKRVDEYAMGREAMKLQEDPQAIKSMVLAGVMDKTEAQMVNARGKMHERTNSAAEITLIGAGHNTVERIVEDELSIEKKPGLLSTITDKLGMGKLERAIAREKRHRSQFNWKHKCPPYYRAVVSPAFEGFFGFVTLLNSAMVGVQISAEQESDVAFLQVYEHVFTSFFLVEIVLRVIAYGWIWFFDFLNMLDLLIVLLTGVLPLWILMPLGVFNGHPFLRAAQVMRTARLVRIVTMFRSTARMRIPFKLFRNFTGSLSTVFHTFLIVCVSLYSLSVFALHIFMKTGVFTATPIFGMVTDLFGDVFKAMFTLFQMMTLDGWTSMVRPLMPYTTTVLVFALVNIMIMTFVISNLITAVIIHSALNRSDGDEEMLALERREKLEAELKQLGEVFHSIDSDHDGLLSKEEVNTALLDNEYLRQRLDALNLSIRDIGDIWQVFDVENDGVNEEVFLRGMRGMMAEAKAKDSFSAVQRIKRINNRVNILNARLQEYKGSVSRLRTQATLARKELNSALHEVTLFVQSIGECVPRGPAERPMHQIKAAALTYE